MTVHYLRALQDELADTVGVLHDGRLVAEGSSAALKERAEAGAGGSLEDVFLEVTADHAEEHATTDGAMGE